MKRFIAYSLLVAGLALAIAAVALPGDQGTMALMGGSMAGVGLLVILCV